MSQELQQYSQVYNGILKKLTPLLDYEAKINEKSLKKL